VGAGPAGLIAAETLAAGGARVVVFEHMATVGRKLLLAGRGGLNLTHSEDVEVFLTRYRPASPQLEAAVRAFPPLELRAWADALGETTFVGTSGRVFPKSFRAAPLLRAWLVRLGELGVEIRVRHAWTDWPLVMRPRDGDDFAFAADAVVLACGGASWPRTGSDGSWVARLPAEPLRPSNMGVVVSWSDAFVSRFAGTPLKDVALSFDGLKSRGDAVVTTAGLEGGAVYALSGPLRDALAREGVATLVVDNRPNQSAHDLVARLRRRRPKSTVSAWLRAAGLSPVEISLLREATGNQLPQEPDAMAALVKATPVAVAACQPIDRAISSAGGVRFTDIDARFMLRDRPGVFVVGEMLDWEAPTGGYLLQGCFSTGVAAANGVLSWLGLQPGE
jgi:uncharacterized flavoprotein (TIGR03862 family)